MLFVAFAGLSVGCTSNYRPFVPLVGQAPEGGCGEKKAAYVFPHAQVAVCMDERVVTFTTCVSQLSLSETSAASSSKIAAEVDVVEMAKLGAEYAKAEALIAKFAQGGPLEKARADAVALCSRLAAPDVAAAVAQHSGPAASSSAPPASPPPGAAP